MTRTADSGTQNIRQIAKGLEKISGMTEGKVRPSADKDLAERVAKRQEQLRKYLEFAVELIDEIGQQTHYEQGNCHTEVKKVVRDFGGLEFSCHFGMSSMGGNEISIGLVYAGIGTTPTRTHTVMKVYSQSHQFNLDECRVDQWSIDPLWCERLEAVIEDKQLILEARAKSKVIVDNAKVQAAEKAKAETELRKKAIRLGVLPDHDAPEF